MSDDRTVLQQEAERLGLGLLFAQYPEAFTKAKASATRFLDSVPRDLPMSDEPAHTFRANA